MSFLYGIEVEEHYPGAAPERWGVELVEKIPEVGDVLQLHWLKESGAPGGREAHRVRVFRVDQGHGLVAHVRSLAQRFGEFEDLRARVVRACEAAVARGWKIAPGAWAEETGPASGDCCPLAAVVWERPGRLLDTTSSAAAFAQVAEVLGVDERWARAFVEGYESSPEEVPSVSHLPEDELEEAEIVGAAWELGREMAERYPG